MTIVYPVNERLMLRKARDTRIVRMSAQLAALGHKVILLVGRSGVSRTEIIEYYGIDDLPNLEIVQIPILRKGSLIGFSWNGIFYLFALIALIRRSRRERIDVIYLSVLKLAAFLLRFRGSIRADRFVYELHELGIYPENGHPNRAEKEVDRLEREVVPRTDGLIVTTEAIAQVARSRFPNLPIISIPLGTPSSGLPLAVDASGLKESYNVCYIGQLYPAQGVDLLVRACARLDRVLLHIIGGREEEIARLRSLAEEVGVSGRVTFHGFLPPKRIPSSVAKMDIFALPARDTTRMNYVAHIKIYEYMSYGRPIVATALRSTLEELQDGENAVLVKPDDPEALAEGIQKVIDRPELARKIGANALKGAPTFFWEKRVERIERFITGLTPSGVQGDGR